MAKNTSENGKKLAILTSGGDSSGMNACIRTAVRSAMNKGYEVYGVRHGYVGLMNDDIFQMQYSSVSNCVHTGGTILRTGRTDEFKKISVQKEAAKNLTKRGVNNLIVIGGDGSFRGIEDLHQNTPLNVIGVPGTIDNDMGYTDYTIGFDTACNTVLDAMLKLRDTITSHDRIMILEVMGRHCGDIALKTALAGGAEYVILPEAPTDVDAIAASVKKGFDKGKTSTIIVLAEGRNDLKDELMMRLITTCVDYCRWAFLLPFFNAECRSGDMYAYELFTRCGFKTIRYSVPFYENRDGVRVLEFVAKPPTLSPQLATIAGVELSWD